MTEIYGKYAHDYRRKGYSPLPLPPGKKTPPPTGWTGEFAYMASGSDVQYWIDDPEYPEDANIALRLPDGVIGIDLDDWGSKTGAATFADAAEKIGSRPPSSGKLTSRDPKANSGIRLFRVPAGTKLAGTFAGAGLGPDIDIIQTGHRYCVGPGSIHPEGGTYTWYDRTPAGWVAGEIPAVDQLPELPAEWIEALQPKKAEPREEIPHEAYDQMAPELRKHVDSYVDNAVERELANLEALKRLEVDQKDANGLGWELGVLEYTRALGSLVKADWNSLQMDSLRERIEAALPHDAGFSLGSGWSKFERAVIGDRVPARVWPETLEEARDEIVNPWWTDGMYENRFPFVAADGSSEPPSAGVVTVDVDEDDWPEEPWNELGDVERTKRWAGKGLRWLADEEVWVRWVPKEHRWAKDPKAGARACQRALRAAEQKEILNYDDTEQLDKDGQPKPGSSRRDKFLVEIRNRWGIGQFERVAKSLALSGDLDSESTEFDADGMLLAVKDGAVDLRTGEFVPGRPELKITVGSNVVFDPQATAPLFQQYLETSMPDPEMREYLQRVMGYSMIGGNPEAAFFIHWGPQTGNGKSVLMKVLRGIMGSQMRAASSKALLKTKGDKHTVEIADLAGPRVLQMGETAEGASIEEETVKAITGGDLIAARKLNQSNRDWDITGKVHIVTNYKPHISASPSMKRRMHLIVWPVEIVKADQDLPAKILANELSGVLNWLIEGCLNWQKERKVERGAGESNTGLVRPQTAEMEVDQYLFEEDSLAEWMLERLNPEAADVETKSSVLYEDYKMWCWPRNIKPMTPTAFGRKFRERRIGSKRKGDGVYYPLALKVTVQQPGYFP